MALISALKFSFLLFPLVDSASMRRCVAKNNNNSEGPGHVTRNGQPRRCANQVHGPLFLSTAPRALGSNFVCLFACFLSLE